MAYLPKSQFTHKTAGEGEFVYKSDKKPFIGPYCELSSGEYREGKGIDSLGDYIIPKVSDKKDNTYIIGASLLDSNVNQYSKIKEKTYKEQNNFEPIIFTKPIPTKKDFKKGTFMRYFCLRANTLNDYKEITEKTYKSLNKKEKKYDFNLHYVGQIEWSLSEEIASKKNSINIKRLKFFAKLSILFPNLEEYAMPDSLFRPKTQIEKIEEQNNPPILPEGSKLSLPNKIKSTKLEKVQKEAIAEVQNVNKNKNKKGSLKNYKNKSSITNINTPGLKASISHLKMFKGPKGRSSTGGSTSGGGGGGY